MQIALDAVARGISGVNDSCPRRGEGSLGLGVRDRSRNQLGEPGEDPVCGQLVTSDNAVLLGRGGAQVLFCSQECLLAYLNDRTADQTQTP
jgi:YHS domain-containing protein